MCFLSRFWGTTNRKRCSRITLGREEARSVSALVPPPFAFVACDSSCSRVSSPPPLVPQLHVLRIFCARLDSFLADHVFKYFSSPRCRVTESRRHNATMGSGAPVLFVSSFLLHPSKIVILRSRFVGDASLVSEFLSRMAALGTVVRDTEVGAAAAVVVARSPSLSKGDQTRPTIQARKRAIPRKRCALTAVLGGAVVPCCLNFSMDEIRVQYGVAIANAIAIVVATQQCFCGFKRPSATSIRPRTFTTTGEGQQILARYSLSAANPSAGRQRLCCFTSLFPMQPEQPHRQPLVVDGVVVASAGRWRCLWADGDLVRKGPMGIS